MTGNYKTNSGNSGFNYSYMSNEVPGNSIHTCDCVNSDFECCVKLVGTTTINFQSQQLVNLRLSWGFCDLFSKTAHLVRFFSSAAKNNVAVIQDHVSFDDIN